MNDSKTNSQVNNAEENALKLTSELLKLPLEDIKEYSNNIENEPSLIYISIPTKGGDSLIIDKNTLEFLYASSAVSFDEHLEEYKKGTRNKKEDFIDFNI